jgi:hypothetical protein
MNKERNKITAIPIEEYVIPTYTILRLGIGFLALALPIILVLVGFLFFKVHLQDSLSAYYHAYPSLDPMKEFLESGKGSMRNWFVGILWTIGVFLILYRGFGRRENWALNVAGILLVMVAMFPMEWICIPSNSCGKVSIHGTSALIFFLAISYVCIFRSGDTLPLVHNREKRDSYKVAYRVIGYAMAGFPIVVTTLNFFNLSLFGQYTIIVLESMGIWIFACYWILKSIETLSSAADSKAIRGHLSRSPRKRGLLQYLLDTTPLNFTDHQS